MLPDCIDNTDFRCIKVDEKFIISLHVKALPEVLYFMEFFKQLDKSYEYSASIYVYKLDMITALNNITYNLTLNLSELATSNKNQRDIDIIDKSSKEAKELRKKVQTDNQEIYNIDIVFSLCSDDLSKLLKSVSHFKAKLYSQQVCVEITNFRHLDFYLLNLPLFLNTGILKEKLYITTSALANLFPFFIDNFVDESGIFIGNTKENNRICMLDIFSEKYENANMCILGSSGSGKSFFTKLFIIRNFFNNVNQIVFDIEGEYKNLCLNLNEEYITTDSYFNILQITTNDIKYEDYLKNKIERVATFFKEVMKCDIDKLVLINELRKLYASYNITDDLNSVLTCQEGEKISLDYKLIDKSKYPTLYDLKQQTDSSSLKKWLSDKLDNELSFFSKSTTIDLNKRLYVFNIKNIIKNLNVLAYILDKIVNEWIGYNKTIIYIDEMWQYAIEKNVLDTIFNMYKTIRKRNGSIVTISQDINDFFNKFDGFYSNGILNNSCFKLLFKTEYNQSDLLSKLMNISVKEINMLKKGEMYFKQETTSIAIKVLSNDFERKLLNEDDNLYK